MECIAYVSLAKKMFDFYHIMSIMMMGLSVCVSLCVSVYMFLLVPVRNDCST